jgi:hypothetical protein
MTDQAARAHAERPKGCDADLSRDYARCARCGLAWSVEDPSPPACHPMSFADLKDALSFEIQRLESSHKSLVEIAESERFPADPLPALQRAMKLAAVSRLVFRVAGDQRIVDLLIPGRREKSRNG